LKGAIEKREKEKALEKQERQDKLNLGSAHAPNIQSILD
jgi:hypothetical protein